MHILQVRLLEISFPEFLAIECSRFGREADIIYDYKCRQELSNRYFILSIAVDEIRFDALVIAWLEKPCEYLYANEDWKKDGDG